MCGTEHFKVNLQISPQRKNLYEQKQVIGQLEKQSFLTEVSFQTADPTAGLAVFILKMSSFFSL
jgi:hypothetical protein